MNLSGKGIAINLYTAVRPLCVGWRHIPADGMAWRLICRYC